MRLFATSFRALACVAGVPSRAATNAALGFPLNAARAAEASLACAPPSCATSASSASCPPISRRHGWRPGPVPRRPRKWPRSRRWPAMRRGGRRASSRCRFRGVGERRHFLHDCGVEGVVGEIAGEVERGAAVFAVGVFQRGEQFRRLFLASVPRTIPRPAARTFCGMPVLRRALAAATALLFPAAASRASRAT